MLCDPGHGDVRRHHRQRASDPHQCRHRHARGSSGSSATGRRSTTATTAVARLINPAAFGIGIYGNLSPQQSPLNKPLQGITATQRSSSARPTDTELSLINQGGIDVILPPTQSRRRLLLLVRHRPQRLEQHGRQRRSNTRA
jgi:hypothetical protein